LSIDSSKRFKSVQIVNNKRNNLKTSFKSFQPAQIIQPKTPLPHPKSNRSVHYPRDPLTYCMSAPVERSKEFKYPPRLVNQHNLKEQTKLRLYFPKELDFKSDTTIEINSDENKLE
jgi:hypothetical protein